MIAEDGRMVWVHDRASLVRDDQGRPIAWQGILFDITERKETEQQLRDAEERYRTLVEQIPAVVYIEEDDERAPAVYVSPRYEELLGYTPEERLAEPEIWKRQLHPADREQVIAEVERTARTGEPFGMEFRMITKDGRIVWIRDESRVITVGAEGRRLWQGFLMDISEQKGAEAERQRLLTHLVQAQGDERMRLASNIHDDSVQKMTAVGLRLATLRRAISDPEQLAAIDRLQDSVSQSISRLRHLLFELRPPALDREGLVAALRQYAVDVTEEDRSLALELDDQMVEDPPVEIRTIAYRIAQEALTNVRKHSGAGGAEVRLQPRDGGLYVRIRDDGRGFSEEGADGSELGHLGLPAMRERAELAGGWLRVESAPGKGTSVEFWLPAGDGFSASHDPATASGG